VLRVVAVSGLPEEYRYALEPWVLEWEPRLCEQEPDLREASR
jgi:hypothetical protein